MKLYFLIFSLLFSSSLSQTSCDNNNGICININEEKCDGILKYGYCSGANNIMCCESNATIPSRCTGIGPDLLPNSYEFTLKNQGFDNHPGALVYIPTIFDKNIIKDNGIEITVYIHGYYNCIRNIVRSQDLQCNCSANQDIREGYNLINQFEEASIYNNNKNHIFVAAEVAYDQANDSPGNWSKTNLFHDFLDELLTQHLFDIIGDVNINDINRIKIFSHSGGYYVIGNMAIVGGVNDLVKDLCLLDSLYANFAQFDTFVETNLLKFGNNYLDYRFSSIYSLNGGTYNNNQIMANKSIEWTNDANCSNILLIDNTNTDITSKEIQNYSLIYKYTTLAHDDIPRNYFYNFLINAL